MTMAAVSRKREKYATGIRQASSYKNRFVRRTLDGKFFGHLHAAALSNSIASTFDGQKLALDKASRVRVKTRDEIKIASDTHAFSWQR